MPDRPLQFQHVLIDEETTWGTDPNTSPVRLNHVTSCVITPDVTVATTRQMGNYAGAVTPNVTRRTGTASIEQVASYGDIGLWLESLLGDASDTGTATPYTHTIDVNPTANTAAAARVFYTIQHGQTGQGAGITEAGILLGGLATEMTVSVRPNEPVTMSVNLVGKDAQETEAMNTGTDYYAAGVGGGQIILPGELTVYLDPLGSAGGTALDCDALEADITIRAVTPLTFGLGDVTACDWSTTAFETSVRLVATADNTTVSGAFDNLLGATPAVATFDLQFTFSKSANYSWVLILPMTMTRAPEFWRDQDGLIIVDTEWTGVYSASSSAGNGFIDSVLTNNKSTI